MAHFAQLDDNNKVLKVIVVNNNELLNNGIESEQKGIDFCKSLFGQDTKWKQTSYNTKNGVYYTPNSKIPDPDQSKEFRKNFAGIDHIFDENLNAFIPPKNFSSWIFDQQKFCWKPPIEVPSDSGSIDEQGRGINYRWDENTVNWIKEYIV